MKIKITGSNGYLGTLISSQLKKKGHEVSGINREFLYDSVDILKEEIKDCDIIVNLAGAPVLQRWTKKNKSVIYNSRVKTTQNLVHAIQKLNKNERPKKFISTSAIGIYKSGLTHDESSTDFAIDFIGQVTKDWEKPLTDLPENVQKHVLRIGLVIGKNSKTIKNLVPIFKIGLGGKIGSSKQAFPFIHEEDAINAFLFAIERNNTEGIYNLVAPERITNNDFTKTLSKILERNASIPVPSFILKIIYGQAASLLLESPVVESKALIESDFKFSYPTIESSLTEILA